jgi:hypothetical protein
MTLPLRVGLFVCVALAAGCAPGRQAVRLEAKPTTVPPGPAYQAFSDPVSPPRNVLVLSGGGMYGAYTAGYLNGWTAAGTRPQFDIVTGVSTGSLIACAAFLGSDYDSVARTFYTSVRASDIYTIRSWATIPWAGSVASSKPLQELIEKSVTDDVIRGVAEGHKCGRRLYVGTTDLSTKKLVIWDMGAMACRGGPDGAAMFRGVLLASCSVPGVLPPVWLNYNGKEELHCDGGPAGQLFVPPNTIKPNPDGTASTTNVYIIIAGKLFADTSRVKPRVLNVLGNAATGILYSHCRGEIANLYHLSKIAGANFHLTALPQEFTGDAAGLSFDPKVMNDLFDAGRTAGARSDWLPAPPFDAAGTDAPRK